MDLLTHIASGLAAGTAVAAFSTKKSFVSQAGIIALSGFGGALPDVDAVSLWSKFDSTIGWLFGLNHPGKVIYSEKFWYSHHGFFHSLFAALLFAALVATVGYLIRSRFRKLTFRDYIKSFRLLKPALIGFIAGFVIHLLEDMPTPASDWGGVRLLWPMETYFGGTGDIWWWNNYDLFLIAGSVFIAGVVLLLMRSLIRFNVARTIVVIFALGCVMSLIQIRNRDNDYAYSGYTDKYQQMEAASKLQQRKILGKRLYKVMEKLDSRLPIYF